MERRFWEGQVEVIEIYDDNGNLISRHESDWSKYN